MAATVDVFVFPLETSAEAHIRLQGFVNPTTMYILLDYEVVETVTTNIENKVYVVRFDDLVPGTGYDVNVEVVEDGQTYYGHADLEMPEKKTRTVTKAPSHFKDFFIAVGQPGPYSNNMEYSEVFGLNQRFGIKIKHAPYSPMAKVKNVVVQSWKDEDGDDVWLPRTAGSTPGTYNPAITHESVEYNPTFVIFGDKDKVDSNAIIRQLLNVIEGRWLKVWDEYTQMGFEGVFLVDVDDDPKFKRRNYDYVQFALKFKINGTNIDAPFEGVG